VREADDGDDAIDRDVDVFSRRRAAETEADGRASAIAGRADGFHHVRHGLAA
jgi:hypothetical protein